MPYFANFIPSFHSVAFRDRLALTDSKQGCEACRNDPVKCILSHISKDLRHKKVSTCSRKMLREQLPAPAFYLYKQMHPYSNCVRLPVWSSLTAGSHSKCGIYGICREIIFQMLSGPTPLQRLRATHIASTHRGLGAQYLSICVFKLPPYRRGFTLITAVGLHRS